MGKSPSSTTQNTYPPWLMSALQPLIKGSTQRLGQFANQGWNVLQGQPAGEGKTGATTGAGGGGMPKWLLDQMDERRR